MVSQERARNEPGPGEHAQLGEMELRAGLGLTAVGAPGLALFARRMGMRDGPRGTATEALLARYAEVTRDVRAAYLAVLGLAE